MRINNDDLITALANLSERVDQAGRESREKAVQYDAAEAARAIYNLMESLRNEVY